MKVKNEYTASIKNAPKYNPNNFTAFGSAIFYVVLLLAFFFVPLLMYFSGFSQMLTDLAGDDYYLQIVINMVILQVIILACGLIFSAIARVNPIRGGGYRFKFDLTPVLFACLLVAGIQICFSPLHMQFSDSAAFFGGELALDEEASGSALWLIVYLILVPLLPCICEEIAFRGIIMRGFSRFGAFTAVILSSAMFALFHGNFQQLIIQFIGGVAIGAAVYITKNFLVGSAMHFFNNAFSLLFGIVESVFAENEALSNLFVMITTIGGIVMLVVGAYYFIRLYLRNKGVIPDCAMFGRPDKPIPILMSAERRATNSSIIIDVTELERFKYFYPDAMRFSNGKFISLKKERSSAPAIVFIILGILLAVGSLLLSLVV